MSLENKKILWGIYTTPYNKKICEKDLIGLFKGPKEIAQKLDFWFRLENKKMRIKEKPLIKLKIMGYQGTSEWGPIFYHISEEEARFISKKAYFDKISISKIEKNFHILPLNTKKDGIVTKIPEASFPKEQEKHAISYSKKNNCIIKLTKGIPLNLTSKVLLNEKNIGYFPAEEAATSFNKDFLKGKGIIKPYNTP